MKSKRLGLIWATVLAAAALAGCSTPETRIKSNPEVFARLNPDQQAMVSRGQVGIGLNTDAVHIALGRPDRITLRTNSEGQSQIWHYVDYVYTPAGGYWGRGWGGWGGGGRRGGWGGGWGSYDFGPGVIAHPYDKYVVEFRAGAVYSVTQQM